MVSGIYQGVNSNSLKEKNQDILLTLIKRNESCTRAELAKISGLKPATITKIINRFITSGIIKETGTVSGDKGRQAIGLMLNKKDYAVIGVRLARTYFQIGMFSLTGEILVKEKIKINPREGAVAALDSIIRKINEFLSRESLRKKLVIGVSVPGPYFPEEGRIRKMTDFPRWDEISITEVFAGAFSIPVIIDHDANAGALAEWWEGTAEIAETTSLYIAVGEGIGSGIVIDGNIFYGSYGTAGEIGHASIDINGMTCECGNRGCLTLYASVSSVMKYIDEVRPDYPGTMIPSNYTFEDFIQAVKNEDPLAISLVEKVARYLSCGIINAICAYSPSEIIIGDQMAGVGSLLTDEIQNIVQNSTLGEFSKFTRIRISELPEDSAFVGSGSLALNHLFKNLDILPGNPN